MPKFQIKTLEMQNGVVCIVVSGPLDMHTSEEMERTIHGLFQRNIYRLVVDLSRLEYTAGTQANVFIGAVANAQESGGNIILVKPSPSIKEVFDLLNLSQVFAFADDLESAVKSFD